MAAQMEEMKLMKAEEQAEAALSAMEHSASIRARAPQALSKIGRGWLHPAEEKPIATIPNFGWGEIQVRPRAWLNSAKEGAIEYASVLWVRVLPGSWLQRRWKVGLRGVGQVFVRNLHRRERRRQMKRARRAGAAVAPIDAGAGNRARSPKAKAKARPRRPRKNKKTVVPFEPTPGPVLSERPETDKTCFMCGMGGDLIRCARCPRQYHVHCLPAGAALPRSMPAADWYCPSCTK